MIAPLPRLKPAPPVVRGSAGVDHDGKIAL
jgi:hypothetical protein